MIRPDPGWLAHRRALLDPAPLAPPPTVPAVDVAGWRPATSVVHYEGGMTVWHGPDDPCELCPKAGGP